MPKVPNKIKKILAYLLLLSVSYSAIIKPILISVGITPPEIDTGHIVSVLSIL